MIDKKKKKKWREGTLLCNHEGKEVNGELKKKNFYNELSKIQAKYYLMNLSRKKE